MALSIKDERTDRMVRRYARLHRTSYTSAIRRAVGEALEREGQLPEHDETLEDFMTFVRELQADIAAAPLLDPRPLNDILYDEDGLPK